MTCISTAIDGVSRKQSRHTISNPQNHFIMARYYFNTDKIFFPVELCRLYWESPYEKDMFGNVQQLCDNYFAVVDIENNSVFATVTKDYELILNKDAADLAVDMFAYLFHLSDNNLCYATNYFTTAKRSEFEMDFIRDFEAQMPLVNEGWRPMAKVVNSYNKHRKLSVNIGYCKVDERGHSRGAFLIPGLSVELSSAHNHSIRSVRRWMFDELTRNPNMNMLFIEQQFQTKMERLKELKISEKNMLPLFCKIYGLTLDPDSKPAQKTILFRAIRQAYLLIQEHTILRDGKADAYTFFYAMMEYATFYKGFAESAQTAISQLRLGGWLNDFITATSERDFDYVNYVGKDALRTALWFLQKYKDK